MCLVFLMQNFQDLNFIRSNLKEKKSQQGPSKSQTFCEVIVKRPSNPCKHGKEVITYMMMTRSFDNGPSWYKAPRSFVCLPFRQKKSGAPSKCCALLKLSGSLYLNTEAVCVETSEAVPTPFGLYCYPGLKGLSSTKWYYKLHLYERSMRDMSLLQKSYEVLEVLGWNVQ